jgi:Cd(II)/Pb(II)-responsive transcriptional regulator
MKIGELARATGTQTETIRFYEKQGLLPAPVRSEGNYRSYDKSHEQRLAFIRHCRCLDMTLDEIRVLLDFKDAPQDNCAIVNQALDDHIEHVVARITQLKALERQLRTLRAECTEAVAQCGVLDGLTRGASEHNHGPAGPSHQHVAGTHGRAPARRKPASKPR